ncbi:hypothetical protein RKD27_000016 [Streptomyces sp. SAI-126]|jgi:hypothetical protein|uniref:hypothetical protein n=1 Tax=unclassified Streptomyces TaxID=2593676 RepID=UPI0036E3773A
MTEPFELPEGHTALDDEQLAAALAGAVQAFDAKAMSSLVAEKDITELRSLASAVEAMRTEQNDRITAAKAAAAEIEQLAAQVRGDDLNAAPAVEEPVVDEPAAELEPDPEPVVACAAMVRRPALNLASVRAV